MGHICAILFDCNYYALSGHKYLLKAIIRGAGVQKCFSCRQCRQ